jgi:hypothetical protein
MTDDRKPPRSGTRRNASRSMAGAPANGSEWADAPSRSPDDEDIDPAAPLDPAARRARIAARAHMIWEREGKPDGRAAEHWAEAERELLAEGDAPAPGGIADGDLATGP